MVARKSLIPVTHVVLLCVPDVKIYPSVKIQLFMDETNIKRCLWSTVFICDGNDNVMLWTEVDTL
jgi:hypothetical protein